MSSFLRLLAIWLIMFLQIFVLKSMGVMLPALLKQFDTKLWSIGTNVSLIMFSGNLIGLSAHAFTKVINVRILVILCGIFSSLGLFISTLANEIFVLLVGMILTGFACMANTLAIGQAPLYFTTWHDTAMNIITSSHPVAIMISAPLTQFLLDVYELKGAMLIINGFLLHVIVAATLLKPLKNDSHQVTYHHLQNAQCSSERNEHWFQDILNITLLKNRKFLMVLVIAFVNGYVLNGWVVYLVSIGQYKGLTPVAAANVSTFSGIGSFFIRIILACIQRHTSQYKMLCLIGSALVMLSYGGMVFASSFWLLSICSLGIGFGYGILGSQVFNLANSTVEEDNVVGAVAFVNMLYGTGYIASGCASGWLFDISGTFTPTIIAQCAVACLIPATYGIDYLYSVSYFQKQIKQDM